MSLEILLIYAREIGIVLGSFVLAFIAWAIGCFLPPMPPKPREPWDPPL